MQYFTITVYEPNWLNVVNVCKVGSTYWRSNMGDKESSASCARSIQAE